MSKNIIFNPFSGTFDFIRGLVSPSTDNAIVRFDGASGEQQDSGVLINDSDQIELIAGSNATPSLSFAGDTDTGIHSPGADRMKINCGGATAGGFELRKSSGNYTNVAIGSAASTDDKVIFALKRNQNNNLVSGINNSNDGAGAACYMEMGTGLVTPLTLRFGVYSSNSPGTVYQQRAAIVTYNKTKGMSFVSAGTTGSNDIKFYVGGIGEANRSLQLEDDTSAMFFGGLIEKLTTVTATTLTLDATHKNIYVDTSSNSVTITLPAVASHTGRIYTIKNIDATNTATVDGNASETIDGSLTQVLALHASMKIQSDGSSWWII